MSLTLPLLLDQFKRNTLIGDLVLGTPRSTQGSTNGEILEIQTLKITLCNRCLGVFKVSSRPWHHSHGSVLPNLRQKHVDQEFATIQLVHEPIPT